MIAFLVYMYTIRFIRLLRFNRKISVLGDTLMHVGKPIVNFMIVFIVAFCAFAMTAYIFFGRNLRTFRNFVTTLETLISMMLSM
jgi:polycystin 1L2